MKRNFRSSHADSFSRSCFSLQDLRRRSIVPTVSNRDIVVTVINIVEGYICYIDRSEQTEEWVEIDSKPRCG
jgi:hypothetical protein